MRLEAETAPLWRALADPTRRRILDRLRVGPAITGEIAAAFPISRIDLIFGADRPSRLSFSVRARNTVSW